MRKKLFSGWCAFCAFLWLIPLSQAEGKYTLDQVFSKMDEMQKDFRSTTADIERTHLTVLVNDKDVSSGKFYYTRRGKEPRVKLELSKPMSQYLLIDRGKLQLYTPNLKQVQEASISGHQDKVEMFMALGFGQSSQDLKKNFDVSLAGEEAVDGKKTSILELIPKNRAMFKSVRMWMDQEKWVAVQLRTTENTGDYMIFKYSNVKINTNIPDSVFDLKMPKDVHVIKM
ncbi:MAG TPA: outer-membrane lipoprotein carrier protein LolA [Terriglobia bacterium]|nr:outer-membrane lipoprotein carrier protein LolA [Terriglobia bacterium]